MNLNNCKCNTTKKLVGHFHGDPVKNPVNFDIFQCEKCSLITYTAPWPTWEGHKDLYKFIEHLHLYGWKITLEPMSTEDMLKKMNAEKQEVIING